jgi:hypothetical protein
LSANSYQLVLIPLFTYSSGAGWSNDTLEGFPDEESAGERKRQVAFFGVYDGFVPFLALLTSLHY